MALLLYVIFCCKNHVSRCGTVIDQVQLRSDRVKGTGIHMSDIISALKIDQNSNPATEIHIGFSFAVHFHVFIICIYDCLRGTVVYFKTVPIFIKPVKSYYNFQKHL